LNAAKGKYIMRVDADDYLISPHVLSTMLHKIRIDGCEIIYPDNLRGNVIQGGREMHHVGGTMFRKKALDFLCFTEGLRHFEGLDLYKRAKKHNLKIGYYHHIGFYYRQHDDSMSKSRCDERQNVKCKLDRGLMGACLL
jgi:glycosyltransferase involved in cell wall biosynthesis